MPDYLFVCVGCVTSETIQQSIRSPLIPPSCPGCNERMKLQMYPAATHFKGTGWGGKT